MKKHIFLYLIFAFSLSLLADEWEQAAEIFMKAEQVSNEISNSIISKNEMNGSIIHFNTLCKDGNLLKKNFIYKKKNSQTEQLIYTKKEIFDVAKGRAAVVFTLPDGRQTAFCCNSKESSNWPSRQFDRSKDELSLEEVDLNGKPCWKITNKRQNDTTMEWIDKETGFAIYYKNYSKEGKLKYERTREVTLNPIFATDEFSIPKGAEIIETANLDEMSSKATKYEMSLMVFSAMPEIPRQALQKKSRLSSWARIGIGMAGCALFGLVGVMVIKLCKRRMEA